MSKRSKGSKANRYINPGINDYYPARSNNVINPGTVLWFGKHRGKVARDVPKSYFRWVKENLNFAVHPDLYWDEDYFG